MYTQKKPIENTHIVRERDRRRFRELLAVLSLGVPIGLFLLLFTWQNLEVIRLGHEATRLQKQLKDVEIRNRALQLELDGLTSLDSVEKQAVALGFEATPAASIVMVSPGDGTTRVVRQALAAPDGGLGSGVAGLQSGDAVRNDPPSTPAAAKSGSSGLQSAFSSTSAPLAVAAATRPDGRR